MTVHLARNSPTDAAAALFAGTGEMRALCRQFDWSRTAMGAVESWPVSLATTVRMLLACRQPMFLWWGTELVQIFNDAYRPSFGADGRHVEALGARGPEFWLEIWDKIADQIAAVMAGGDSLWFEDKYLPIFRNGQLEDVYWTYSYSAVYDDEGAVAGVLVVCEETTSQVVLRRRIEVERSRLEYAFQQSPSFLAVLSGPPFVFQFANAAYQQLVGQRELVGRKVFEALPELRGQGFETLLEHVAATGEQYVGREMPISVTRTPNAPAEERFLDFVYFPIVGVDGDRSGIIAHGVDITEQVEARRDVERLLLASEGALRDAELARGEADAANRSKGDFLAMLSHELRTPLAAISGYSELLAMGAQGELTAGQLQFLHRIQHSQRHLLGLIDGLLIYAQAEAGKVQYAFEMVAMDEVIASCETLTLPQAHARQLELRYDSCAATLRAYCDREKVKQILINLLSNAIKFTEPGGRIEVECTCEGDNEVHLVVRDTGPGISADDLARVFEPFVQLEANGGRGRGGTGLGLAISLMLARGMGGDLTLNSTPGVGSAFTLSLPATVR